MNKEKVAERVRALLGGDKPFDVRVGVPSAIREVEAPLAGSISTKVCVGVQFKREGDSLSITRIDVSYQCLIITGVSGLVTPFTIKTVTRKNLAKEEFLAYVDGLLYDVYDHGKYVIVDFASILSLETDERRKKSIIRNEIRRIDEPSLLLDKDVVDFVWDHGVKLDFVHHAETVLCFMMFGAIPPSQCTFQPGTLDNFYHIYTGVLGLRKLVKSYLPTQWTPEVDRDTFVSVVERKKVVAAGV